MQQLCEIAYDTCAMGYWKSMYVFFVSPTRFARESEASHDEQNVGGLLATGYIHNVTSIDTKGEWTHARASVLSG